MVFYDKTPLDNINNLTVGEFSGKEVETVAGCGKGEYLPVNAYKNRFYIASREQGMYVLEGKAIIEKESKDGSNYSAQVKTLDAEYTLFELPYIYYPGYEVRADGVIINNLFETENGMLGCIIEQDEKVKIEVEYIGTTCVKASLLVSLISMIGFGVYIYKKR